MMSTSQSHQKWGDYLLKFLFAALGPDGMGGRGQGGNSLAGLSAVSVAVERCLSMPVVDRTILPGTLIACVVRVEFPRSGCGRTA
jgi:hypothetical protein